MFFWFVLGLVLGFLIGYLHKKDKDCMSPGTLDFDIGPVTNKTKDKEVK